MVESAAVSAEAPGGELGRRRCGRNSCWKETLLARVKRERSFLIIKIKVRRHLDGCVLFSSSFFSLVGRW